MEFAGIPREYPPNGCFGEYGGAAFRVAEWRLWAVLSIKPRIIQTGTKGKT